MVRSKDLIADVPVTDEGPDVGGGECGVNDYGTPPVEEHAMPIF